jgi:hypothetical protein
MLKVSNVVTAWQNPCRSLLRQANVVRRVCLVLEGGGSFIFIFSRLARTPKTWAKKSLNESISLLPFDFDQEGVRQDFLSLSEGLTTNEINGMLFIRACRGTCSGISY